MVKVESSVSKEKYVHLKNLTEQAPGQTMSGIIRNILENRPIKLHYHNFVLDQMMHQLSRIYCEIHRIDVNVNRFVKEFHQANQPMQKFLLGKKLIDNQQLIQREIESLKPILSELQQRWLPE